MDNERLVRVIARIEQAAEKIGSASAVSRPADDGSLSQLKAELEAAKATLGDRDRTIAKLQADSKDIGRLKDEEIERLRKELRAQMDAEPHVPLTDHEALRQKYDRLKTAAGSVLAGLDRIIERVERHDNG